MTAREKELENVKIAYTQLERLYVKQEKELDRMKATIHNHETHIEGLKRYIRRLKG